MLRIYSRTVMLGFIVIFLAINIAYAPVKRDGSKIEKSDEEEYDTKEIGADTQFEALDLTTQDEFADPEKMTFDEIGCCYKHILLHFKQNDSVESCATYALLNLTIRTPSMMNNNYARPYYLYLSTQIKVGKNMRSPEDYYIDKPDPDYILPEPRSLSIPLLGMLRKKSSKKTKVKGKPMDARVIVLENEFGTTADIALLTAYNHKKIDQFNKEYIDYEYMEHIATTMDLQEDAQSPLKYCTENYKDDAPLHERQPADNISLTL